MGIQGISDLEFSKALLFPQESPRQGFQTSLGLARAEGTPPLSQGTEMGRQDSQSGIEIEEDRDRERDRQVDEDPVAVAAFLQPPAWLRWKR